MYVDKDLQMSVAQNVDTTGTMSENVIDLGAIGDAIGNEPFVEVVVTTQATQSGAGTVEFQLVTHDDEDFGAKTQVGASGPIAIALLVAGYKWQVRLPQGCQRFIGINYLLSESLTAGNFDAFIVADPQTNK